MSKWLVDAGAASERFVCQKELRECPLPIFDFCTLILKDTSSGSFEPLESVHNVHTLKKNGTIWPIVDDVSSAIKIHVLSCAGANCKVKLWKKASQGRLWVGKEEIPPNLREEKRKELLTNCCHCKTDTLYFVDATCTRLTNKCTYDMHLFIR